MHFHFKHQLSTTSEVSNFESTLETKSDDFWSLKTFSGGEDAAEGGRQRGILPHLRNLKVPSLNPNHITYRFITNRRARPVRCPIRSEDDIREIGVLR